jgi:hypothetical protein
MEALIHTHVTAFIALTLFALVHLLAQKLRILPEKMQGKILSTGGGVAIAYVFVDLLPKLSPPQRI